MALVGRAPGMQFASYLLTAIKGADHAVGVA
jgi:hypothetical protein